MSTRLLPRDRMARQSGFGMTAAGDSYCYRPGSTEELADVLALAKAKGRQVVLRGAGRSYGDASVLDEGVSVDIGRMDQVWAFDKTTGIVDCGPGTTIGHLWRRGLEEGYWPAVVSGTMFPTLGGALAMNIHGKNNYCVGTIGEQVQELEFMTAEGKVHCLKPKDELFKAVVSSAGLLGAITRVKIKLKKVQSGDLRILPLSMKDWDHQFETFLGLEHDADYMVSWVDCFASGRSAGRGAFHAAWYLDEASDHPASLDDRHQELPDTIFGLVPKSMMWRFLKPLNNRFGMRVLNAAKQFAGSAMGDGKPHPQSLVAFSFLLDFVPGWRNAYLPGGFIQYQSFVPRESAPAVFARQVELQQKLGLESFLGVLKRHRPDQFLFSHGVDGFSLALDFKVTASNRESVWAMAHRMNEMVLDAGGKFYLAKDSTLRPQDFRASIGSASWDKFAALKGELDPGCLFTSSLAKRLGLEARP